MERGISQNKVTNKNIVFMLLLSQILVLSVMCHSGHCAGKRLSAPAIEEPAPIPEHSESKFVFLGKNASPVLLPGGYMYEMASKAMDLMNAAFISGCLEKKVLASSFKTLERDQNPQIASAKEAWELYKKNAPYALDIRTYYKRASKVVGYTFFYRDNLSGNPTETRIWSNTKFIGSDPKEAASHWAHELSHQARAGSFGHWSRFDGSFPYVVGDLMWECVQ